MVDPGPVLTPRVPHQPYRSNNCGLHSIEMATMIMNDSKEFLDRLDKKTLKEWFPVADCISTDTISTDTIAEQIVSVPVTRDFQVRCYSIHCSNCNIITGEELEKRPSVFPDDTGLTPEDLGSFPSSQSLLDEYFCSGVQTSRLQKAGSGRGQVWLQETLRHES